MNLIEIGIIGFGDDLGMQSGPQISPAMYREFFKPGHEILWNHAKKLCPHIKVSLHCCSGCDTREILPYGTPDQIRGHVRGNIEIMAPGGGFVFQQAHNIMADVPPGNIMAMFSAVRE